LSLQSGENTIRISTDKSCQGTYSETIHIGNQLQLKLVPNPTSGDFAITIPGKDDQVNVEILSLSGSLLYKQAFAVPADRQVAVNAAELNKGIYMVRVVGAGVNATIKLIMK
jgi:hypothetical protein